VRRFSGPKSTVGVLFDYEKRGELAPSECVQGRNQDLRKDSGVTAVLFHAPFTGGGLLRSVYSSKRVLSILSALPMLISACGADEVSEPAATASTRAQSIPSSNGPTSFTVAPTSTTTASTVTAPPPQSTPKPTTSARPPIVAANCTAASAPVAAQSQAGLTDAAMATRTNLIDAARRCDLSALAAIATSSPTPFRFSFGADPGDPTEAWLRNGFDPAILLRLFALDVKHQVFRDSQSGALIAEYFVWPGAAFEPTDHDWQAAEALYSASVLARMRSELEAYVGIRTYITPTGDWVILIEGD